MLWLWVSWHQGFGSWLFGGKEARPLHETTGRWWRNVQNISLWNRWNRWIIRSLYILTFMMLHDGHDSCFLKIFRFLELTFCRFLQLTFVRFCGGIVFRGMYVLVAGCCQSLGDPLPHDSASGRISGTVSLEGMSEFASISSIST